MPSSRNSAAAADVAVQVRRNYDRLKIRNSRTESENAELRKAGRESQADLGRVDAILEEVLGTLEAVMERFKAGKMDELMLTISKREYNKSQS